MHELHLPLLEHQAHLLLLLLLLLGKELLLVLHRLSHTMLLELLMLLHGLLHSEVLGPLKLLCGFLHSTLLRLPDPRVELLLELIGCGAGCRPVFAMP